MLNKNMVSENFDSLFKAAKKVREQAHVPYSNFKVGAAFLTEDSKIITGCMLKMQRILNPSVPKQLQLEI